MSAAAAMEGVKHDRGKRLRPAPHQTSFAHSRCERLSPDYIAQAQVADDIR